MAGVRGTLKRCGQGVNDGRGTLSSAWKGSGALRSSGAADAGAKRQGGSSEVAGGEAEAEPYIA